jgi:hypothetical protein
MVVWIVFGAKHVTTSWFLAAFDTDGEVILAGPIQSANQRVERALSIYMD